MADEPPPAKRVKYAPNDPRGHGHSADSSRLDFKETFQVLTGQHPNQQCFTVHREFFTQRSKFLEAASSSRWKCGTGKPVDLTEHEPEVFASYMQCVYLGSVTVPDLPVYTEDRPLERLITLYLLSDTLNDTTTSNLVMDEIIRMSEELRHIPYPPCVDLAYRSTVAGSPLRKLCRDYYIHEAQDDALEEIYEGLLPFEFLKDVIQEFRRLADQGALYYGRRRSINMEKCHYHLHDDEHPRCS